MMGSDFLLRFPITYTPPGYQSRPISLPGLKLFATAVH